MKSIDTYLCKEKKTVYKINFQPVIGSYAAMTKEAVEAHNMQQDAIIEYRSKCEEARRASWLGNLLKQWGFW